MFQRRELDQITPSEDSQPRHVVMIGECCTQKSVSPDYRWQIGLSSGGRSDGCIMMYGGRRCCQWTTMMMRMRLRMKVEVEMETKVMEVTSEDLVEIDLN